MKGQTGSGGVSGSSGFFREGLRELGRKLERRKLGKQAQQQEQERSTALVLLGQRAWQEKIDLGGFAGLRDQLAQLDGRAGELSASMQKLEGEKGSLEARQKEETGKFDGQRKAVEEKKRPVDASLRTARQRESEQQRTILRITARQASLAAELAQLEQGISALAATAPADQASRLSAAQTRKQQLVAEQATLAEELTQAQAALPAAKAEMDRLSEESRRYEAEINRIEAERQAALSPILADLQRVGGELSAAREQARAVEGERTERFKQLGLALYESKSAEPALAPTIGQIFAIDRARAATQAGLGASLGLTHTMPPGTMLKFWSTVVLVPVLLIGLGYGIYAGWAWWEERHQPKEFEAGPQINPYLSHPLSRHPAYVLAERLAKAKSEQEEANLMLEVFRTIHLGVYTHDGKQVLAGAERSEKDFFLYDFHWKTLARALSAHTVINFSDYSAMLGKTLLQLNDPARLAPVLSRAMLLRYQEALKAPDDPASYLILLIDGLGRHQVKPYSLAEIDERPGKDLYIDPLQSFLIMLDFFTKPPSPAPTTSSRFPWNQRLVPVVFADAPCDAIKGDQEQRYWGYGVKATQTAVEQIGEKVAERATGETARDVAERIAKGAEIADKAMEITAAAGDLVILYGVTMKIVPTNYVFHLRHDTDHIYGFNAKVTFEPDGLPDEPIKCGWLVGKKMPQLRQGLKDVELTWNIEPEWPQYLIVPHGMMDRLKGDLGLQTKTDAQGESHFDVSPTDCPAKHGGRTVGRDLMMTATARILTREMSTPGPLSVIGLISKLGPGGLEFLMQGRTGYCRFRVEWHKKTPKEAQYEQ
jgi:hypothetical protein